MAKILIIDHTPQSRESLAYYLSHNGNIVTNASNIDDGLRQIGRQCYDIIVLDFRDPREDLTLLKQIQKNQPDAVVIIVSGFPSFSHVQLAIKEGAFDYLTKPVNADEVRFVVQRAVSYKKLRDMNLKLNIELSERNKVPEVTSIERAEELALVYQIGQEISSHLDLGAVLRTLVNKVTELLDAEICSVLLADRKSGILTIKAACGLDKDQVLKTRIESGHEISGWVMERREAILVEDIERDQRFGKRNNEKYYTHSFISVPLIVDDEAIGVVNINNRSSRELLTEDNLRLVKALAAQAAIAIENARLFTTLEGTYIHTFMALTSAIDMKDHYTRDHTEHVTEFGVAIAKEIGLSKKETNAIRQACLFHDLGKIGVHDSVLTNPGDLSADEWLEIRQHPTRGAMILRPLRFLGDIVKLVEQHHERFDGTGYPFGLKGEDIMLGARIMAVADSYDAMITDRPYRDALPRKKAVEELLGNRGVQFDPGVVDAFIRVLGQKQACEADVVIDQ
ncbi:MAG: HD domain-containing protein [Candidatus Omnitrophica bacterium]|nr:HD domain-containing protein [Candidatus Omnitrophota bacterium]